MSEFSAKRVMVIAAIAGALVGGAVATAVAVASSSGSDNGITSASGGDSSVTTVAVVRTTLTTAVQVSGSIGFNDSYTVGTPSGSDAQQVSQAQQAVTQDQVALSADEQAETDATAADDVATTAAQTNASAAQSTLSADQATETQDCAGSAASSSACSQDTQKINSDLAAVTQAQQQLATAQASATSGHDQNEAKVQLDRAKLSGDQATLASLQAAAVNPGTTYTALPSVGDIIRQGQSVYSVSNEVVPLLYGSIPAYRAFSVGMSDGADVGELTQDLIALSEGAGLTQSDHYSPSTAGAVERWQRALGLPATGSLLLGQVIFEPGPIRVTSVTPSVGSSVGNGAGAADTVLTATSTSPIVTVDLDVDQEYLVKPGDAVSIVLPDGTSTVGGHIGTVGNVAACPGGGGAGAGSGAGSSTADQSPCESGGSGSSSNPTVTVTITLDSTPALATLDQAPVNVNITTQRADDVLAVPVNALLALQNGGFGVDVENGKSTHLVGVTTGLYSNTLVQVSGSDLSAGARVEVPSS